MLSNTRNLLLGFVLLLMLLPMTVFASTTEHKGKQKVNINRANAAALVAHLPGIGVNKAEIIVKYRKANGKFKNVKDMMNVPGIGEKTYKGMKRYISTTSGVSSPPKGFKVGKSSGNSPSLRKKSTSSNTPTTRRRSNNENSTSNSTNNSTSKRAKLKKIKKRKKNDELSPTAERKLKKIKKKKIKKKKAKKN